MTINSANAKKRPFQWSFLLPQYWLIWAGLMILMLINVLPWRVQCLFAFGISRLSWLLLSSRRLTTITNLTLCFPEWTPKQVELQAKQVFFDTALGLFETLNAWYAPSWFNGRVSIEGLAYLEHAQEDGAGVLLMGTHSSLLDAGGLICSRYFNNDILYRPNNNPFVDYLIYNARAPIYNQQLDRNNIRQLVKRLKDGQIMWYSPDQDFGLSQGVMAPYFGIDAATVTAQRRLIKMGNAKALAVHFYRVGVYDPLYHIVIEPELTNYPSDNELFDATRVNQLLEKQIRRAPTQYMWFHRRFKTRPKGYDRIYPKKNK